jgi:hypothetical protein
MSCRINVLPHEQVPEIQNKVRGAEKPVKKSTMQTHCSLIETKEI